MRRVELFERIREEHRQGASIHSLAETFGVHRRTVRQAIASSTPPVRKPPARSSPALTDEVRSFIDRILEADKTAPRKQRHTARRLWQRVTAELGASVAESSVRRYVRPRRRELGVGVAAFVPQHHPLGRQAEADFYEAQVVFPSGPVTAQIITLRSESSGASLHVAYPSATQAALFEGLARAFAFLGGVFPIVRFDNLQLAVARALRGRRRVEQDRFIAFRSHYGFKADFTSLGIEGAHQKGGIEGEVGRFRRRWLTPVPEVAGWEELNAYLYECCVKDLDRRINGHQETVGQARARERVLLRPLPAEGFEWAEVTSALVDQKCRIRVATNHYSVPVALVGRRVEVRLEPMTLIVRHLGQVVATHPRLHLKWGEHLILDHYLELLRFRPGAFFGSLPLHQERTRGSFPPVYDAFLAALHDRYGERDAVRHMVEILLLHRSVAREKVLAAVATALECGAVDHKAVVQILRADDGERPVSEPIQLTDLARYDRPLPDVSVYDDLLAATTGTSHVGAVTS